MTEEEETQIQSKIPLIQNKSDTDFETDEAGSSSQSPLQSSSQSPHHRPFILNEKKERSWRKFFQILAKFLGPGFMVSVGYLDPGNWATDLAAGSQFGYRLLFIILLSNFMAMLLQSLCVKLGVVTGQDLSQSCRKYFPKWANLILYVLCEIAIMSTDLAEVIGSAIALKLLFHIPLLYGVLITGLDVLVIIMFGFNAKHMRLFEGMIALLVLTTACCLFAVTAKSGPNMGDVAFGYLPSTLIFTNPDALYVAVGIIGATVMPHNLYLHSYIVKYRSNRDDGEIVEIVEFEEVDAESVGSNDTQPLNRIKTLPTTLQMSYLDSSIALTFALFVNSSILIIAGANFYTKGETDIADIEDAFKLIGSYLGSVFAALFAIALLLAGQSSTITGTMAGQIIMEGFLGGAIRLKPWVRRLVTRLLAIGPAIICILLYGESGLNDLLILSQIILSLQLPFAVWPLVYFTSKKEIMTITFSGIYSSEENRDCADVNPIIALEEPSSNNPRVETVDYSNTWVMTFFSVLICLILTIFNLVFLIQVAIGKA